MGRYFIFFEAFLFIILAKKTPSSRSVKVHSPVSRWEMNWLRTRDGRKPSKLFDIQKVLLHYLSNVCSVYNGYIPKWR
ncbi:hypothetical protein BK734_26295 [Bacillus thuringiensis serovar kim]|nr:hypothetical protein BK734_26295 [Bacillus thuringiensis serovar kim]